MTQEEFDVQFNGVLDALLKNMAEHPEIDVKKFYSFSYFIENMAYFGPVIYGMIENAKSKKTDS